MGVIVGGASFLGGIMGRFVRFSDNQMRFFTSFGAGILIAAAIFSMIIEAERELGISLMLAFFVGGSITFAIMDWIVEKKRGEAGILLGIGIDSVPESLAIGASIASGPALALAILLGIQNTPEGIASFHEMTSEKDAPFARNKRKALASIGVVSVLPIILGLIGLFFLQGMGTVIAITLAFSAGGIFLMLFFDMIPKAHKENKRLPAFGAVLGFIIGFAIVRVIGQI